MKILNALALCACILFSVSCSEDKSEETFGTVTLNFDNVVGEDDLELVSEGSAEFPYTNSANQTFNIDLLGYYISEIQLVNADGSVFADELLATATESKGYYQVLEDDAESQFIDLSNVPTGSYESVIFTVGIRGNTVSEGATGGILDPANGAWFWSWNVGYIAYGVEGNSTAYGVEGNSTASGSEGDELAFHIGGWKDPNNIKEVTLDLPTPLIVGEGTESELHIHADVLEILASLDFTTTYSVHSPAGGQPIAEHLPDVFEIHHVENPE